MKSPLKLDVRKTRRLWRLFRRRAVKLYVKSEFRKDEKTVEVD